jgi:methionyl-tRNA formyltransferase
MHIVFFGTPDYVVPVVDSLLKHFRTNANQHPISAVVTQSPKPSGRDQFLTYSPIDEWAYDRKIPKYFNPNDVIKEQINADIGVLASYGQFIPEPVIKYLRYGILNIHPSLLPLWRGASPVQASIISGEVKTGVSIIKLDNKLDHGPIVSQFKDEILETDTTESLRKRLFERSAKVIPTLIEAYIAGKITPKNQDEKSATFTRQIKKEDAFIDPKGIIAAMNGKTIRKKWIVNFIKDFTIHYSPITIHQFIRTMDPWPGAWSTIAISKKLEDIRRLKIIKSSLFQSPVTNRQSLLLDTVQLEGKSPVSWKQFVEGYPEAKFE